MNHFTKHIAGLTVAAFATFGLASQAQAVEVQEVVSDGGIHAWLIEDHQNPLLTMNFSFTGAGAATDPDSKLGLANMVSGLIDEGASQYRLLYLQSLGTKQAQICGHLIA